MSSVSSVSSSSPSPSSSSSSSSTNTLSVDEFYLSALFEEDQIFPISDEKYAEEIQLQEALMSSLSTNVLNTEESSARVTSLKGKEKESGESSGSFHDSVSLCEICKDTKATDEMFTNNKNCTHTFCSDCTASYIATRIQESISVKCPDPRCRGVLDPLLCRTIVSEEVIGRWEDALCENLLAGYEKFYCPFEDCSAMMVVEEGDEVSVTSSECPNCRRLFCAQCRVSWHAGMECGEFQALKKGEIEKDDLLLKELVKDKKWRRCPHCKFYVERVDGCPHISCRCGNQFCYSCGSDWNQHHACPSP